MQLSLKQKIILLVLISIVPFLFISALKMSSELKEHSKAKNAEENINISISISKLIHQIQKERGASTLYIGGTLEENALNNFRFNVDDKKLSFINTLKNSSVSKEINSNVIEIDHLLNGVRNIVNSKENSKEALLKYTLIIRKLLQLELFLADHTKANGEEKRMISSVILEMAKENMGKTRAYIAKILNEHTPLLLEQIATLASLKSGIFENLDSPALIISKKTRTAFEAFKNNENWLHATAVIQHVFDHASTGDFTENPKLFFEKISLSVDDLGEIIFNEQNEIRNLIILNKIKTLTNLKILTASTFTILLLVISLSIYFIKSITGPTQKIMSLLRRSSTDVKKTAQTIKTNGDALSKSSIQQAASLKQAVSSLEEIMVMIGKTNDNTKESQSISQESTRAVTTGQEIVQEMARDIQAIEVANESIQKQINKSNDNLSEIINVFDEICEKTNVINDIVFQTKLLSFNASVEAARAKDAGKGFAVVAEEVGNLANTSGTAAKEITEVLEKSLKLATETINNSKKEVEKIIQLSHQKVEKGIATVNKCSDTLKIIVEQTIKVNELITDIASASEKQTVGINQISTVMHELDKVTHNNAKAAEEAARVGDLLGAKSQELNKAVENLNLIIYSK
ncbi:MAG: methyl-accepting chemotaxis protein [Bacteriovoracaceae bacterium]